MPQIPALLIYKVWQVLWVFREGELLSYVSSLVEGLPRDPLSYSAVSALCDSGQVGDLSHPLWPEGFRDDSRAQWYLGRAVFTGSSISELPFLPQLLKHPSDYPSAAHDARILWILLPKRKTLTTNWQLYLSPFDKMVSLSQKEYS